MERLRLVKNQRGKNVFTIYDIYIYIYNAFIIAILFIQGTALQPSTHCPSFLLSYIFLSVTYTAWFAIESPSDLFY